MTTFAFFVVYGKIFTNEICQMLSQRKFSMPTEAPFTPFRTNFCMDKNLHGSTLRLHGTGGTGRTLEWLSVQVWDLKKAGPKLAHLAIQKFGQFRRSCVNARWNHASFCPCKNLVYPCKRGLSVHQNPETDTHVFGISLFIE